MSTYVVNLTKNITKGSSTEKVCNSNTFKGDITCAVNHIKCGNARCHLRKHKREG